MEGLMIKDYKTVKKILTFKDAEGEVFLEQREVLIPKTEKEINQDNMLSMFSYCFLVAGLAYLIVYPFARAYIKRQEGQKND